MTRLSSLMAVLSFVCAGALVFRQVTTGRMDDQSEIFLLMVVALAFVMLALLFQRVRRLETALNQKNSALEHH
ncbi:hypothetical protein [Brevundimonas sp. Root1423]|uniref:hypothetical protein n=1 Tax=Brevundimonas sp. Root1423 TaxID=1736462 RepID=UPI000B0A357A|nr:hypothetical protein [Brevundimonas sp. Root1423]